MYLALDAGGLGPARRGRDDPDARAPASAYDVVQAFSGLADRAEQIDTGKLRQVDQHARRPDQGHPGGVPGHPARAVPALGDRGQPQRPDQPRCCSNLHSVSGTLSDRDQDIVTLMKDSDILLRALVARRAAVHRLLVSTSRFSTELTAAGPAVPGGPEAGTEQPRGRGQPAAEEPEQPRREPAADGAVLPGLRQHARRRAVVRHLDLQPASRPRGGWPNEDPQQDQPPDRGHRGRWR